MIDIDIAAYLNETENNTFEKLIEHKKQKIKTLNKEKNMSESDLLQLVYEDIIKSTKSSRSLLNDLLGLK